MTSNTWILLGGLLGAVGVAAGAFGAHGLEGLEAKGEMTARQLETFEVAVRYQMYHALALVLVGLLARRPSKTLTLAGGMFLAGILIFSGLLYAWIFTGMRAFAMIVPLGGTAFIVGWVALAVAGWRGGADTARQSPGA